MKKIMYLKITWDDTRITKEGIQTFLENFLSINADVQEIKDEENDKERKERDSRNSN